MPVVVQHRSFGPDSAARRLPQLQFVDKVVTCPLLCSLGDGPDSAQFVQFLDKVFDMPVVSNDRCFGFQEQKTVEVPQLQLVEFFDKVVDITVVAQMQIPMVFSSRPQRFSSCSTLIR